MQSAATKRANRSTVGSQDGFSLIELLIVVAIILIIAAIAIPNMLKSKMAANQAAAVENVRTVTTASVSYWVTYANGYPPNLGALGGVGAPTCNGAILIDEVITAPPYQKSGYTYNLVGDQGAVTNPPVGCAPGFVGYLVTATPINLGVTGNESFCSSEPGIIHYDTTGATAGNSANCTALPTLE